MSSRYGIFSVILFVVVLALGFKNYEIWSHPGGAIAKREVPKRPDSKAETLPPAVAAKEIQPREGYRVIAEKNIFHPDRKEFPMLATEQSRATVRPQITLYGVVVSGNFQSATIVNPGRLLQKGEREPKSVKVGDSVGDYKVEKILEDRIVMANGEDSFEVLLYDPGAPKKRIETKTPVQPAAVTSATGGPTPTPAPGPAKLAPAGPPAGGQPLPALPMPMPQAGAPSAGATIQPPGGQTPSSGAVSTPGAWRGRRLPIPPGSTSPAQGN